MPYGPGTYGNQVGRPQKKQNEDLLLSDTAKAMNTQAPTSFITKEKPQKTMMYGGMAVKKETKPMKKGGTVKYFGNAYAPRKTQKI
jgi:hypothetical protein